LATPQHAGPGEACSRRADWPSARL